MVHGGVRVIFVVDLYNEGVNIPEVNTVLFLRPTESLTIFLQQLGRGLRLSEGKDCLTVLDFIGAANRRYNFAGKFAALLGSDHRSLREEIERGFAGAPRGCYIQLEKKAARAVLDNISRSFRGHGELVSRIHTFTEDSGRELTFAGFLDWYHLTPGDIYGKGVTFARLCVEAGARPDFAEETEALLSRVIYRFDAFDSRRWIAFLLDVLPRLDNVDFAALPPLEQRMLQMFHMTVWDCWAEDWDSGEVLGRLYSLADSPVMLEELLTLLRYQYDRIDFIDSTTDLGFDCPLDVHCTYTQRQFLAALDYRNFSAMRQGVLYLQDKGIDVFLITLNKSDRDYMNMPAMLVAGTNLVDGMMKAEHLDECRTGHADVAWGMRESAHRILYTVVHSNAMNGVSSGTTIERITPWWQTALLAAQILFGALALLSIVLAIIASRKDGVSKTLKIVAAIAALVLMIAAVVTIVLAMKANAPAESAETKAQPAVATAAPEPAATEAPAANPAPASYAGKYDLVITNADGEKSDMHEFIVEADGTFHGSGDEAGMAAFEGTVNPDGSFSGTYTRFEGSTITGTIDANGYVSGTGDIRGRVNTFESRGGKPGEATEE